MQKADDLLRLMKQQTDALLATDEKLQQFLMWVNEKSLFVEVPYKPAAVRAFYFADDLALDRAVDLALDRDLDLTFRRVLNFDLALERALKRVLNLGCDCTLVLLQDLALALDLVLALTLDSELRQSLQQLREQLPNPDSGEERFKQWGQAKGKAWTKQLRAVMIKHRNIGYDWRFSDQQKQLLKQYYDANKLLVDCLNSASNVTPTVRSHIEETLLLPIALVEETGSCQDK
jgi:predicted NACHT family NTPase